MTTIVGPKKIILKHPVDRATIETIIRSALEYCRMMTRGKAPGTFYPHQNLTVEFCRSVDNHKLYDEIQVSGETEIKFEDKRVEDETGDTLSMTSMLTAYSPKLVDRSIREFLEECEVTQASYAPVMS